MTNARLLALSTLPILVLGTAAIADDAKTFSGAMCQPLSSTYLFSRDNNGRMRNTSSGSQTWICPAVRDTMAANSLEYAHVVPFNSVSCTLETRSATGGTTVSVGPKVENGILKYGLGDANVSGAENGYYYFLCSVSANSGIVSYKVEEDE